MKIGYVLRATAAGMISLLLVSGWPAPANADSLDQDDVIPLVAQGRVLPLEQILEAHQARLQGRLIDLELEQEDGRLIYELELLDPQGIVHKYLIDARSNAWLGEDD